MNLNVSFVRVMSLTILGSDCVDIF